MVNWTRDSQPINQATHDVVTSALLEMCHYPKPEFDKFKNTVENACHAAGIICPDIQFEVIVEKMKNGGLTEIDFERSLGFYSR